MEKIQPDIIHSVPQRPPWRNVMLLLGLILIGMSVGNLLAMGAIVSFGVIQEAPRLDQISQMIQQPQLFAHSWWYLMLFHAVSHLFTFLIPGVIYWRWSEQHKVEEFVSRPLPSFLILTIVVVTVLAFLPFNSIIIEWNNNMHLPEGLQQVENWMRNKEDELGATTRFMTDYTSWNKLVIALFVMGLIPSVGEEVLFRGIIQRKIFHKIGDMHASVWLTSALFSTIHLQFYGFVPRILLGALLGYLYFFTRNLWAPIIGHFVNNGLTVLLIFLSHRQVIDFQIGSSGTSVSWVGALISLVLTFALLLILKMISQRSTITANDT